MSATASAARPGVLPAIYRATRTVLAYVGVVAGGLTVFLSLTPLFGYRAYPAQPGPGFPAMGWSELWRHGWDMVQIGVFLAVLYVVPALVLLGAVRLAERLGASRRAVRMGAAAASALLAGYWQMGTPWYFNGSPPFWLVGALLGAAAGAWVLPAGAPRRLLNGGALAALALFAALPAYALWDRGQEHRVLVRFHAQATVDDVERVWREAEMMPQYMGGDVDGTVDGRYSIVLRLHPRTGAERREAFRARLASLPGVESVLPIPRDGP